jgi:uncharacterized membrane protein YqaE (UPF0057 family)
MRKHILLLYCSLLLLLPTVNSNASTLPVSDPLTKEQRQAARTAFEELKNLPRKERMQKLKAARKEIRKFKAARKAGNDVDTNTLLLVVLAILLPPLAVYLHEKETNTKFWVTLLLFLLGIAGAVFFSWLLIFASIVYALLVVLGAA